MSNKPLLIFSLTSTVLKIREGDEAYTTTALGQAFWVIPQSYLPMLFGDQEDIGNFVDTVDRRHGQSSSGTSTRNAVYILRRAFTAAFRKQLVLCRPHTATSRILYTLILCTFEYAINPSNDTFPHVDTWRAHNFINWLRQSCRVDWINTDGTWL